MRSRLSLFPLMAVLAGVVSCQKAPVADPQPEIPALKTFYATRNSTNINIRGRSKFALVCNKSIIYNI